MKIIADCGFKSVEIKKETPIDIPDELLLKYVSPETLEQFKMSGVKIISATIVGVK